jgi:hypothetical protein
MTDGMPRSADVRALGEFAACRHGTFTLKEAAAYELSRGDVRALERKGYVTRLRQGVYRLTSWPESWRADAYASVLGVHAASSHDTAAALHAADGYRDPAPGIHITCHQRAHVRLDDVTVHRTNWLPNADVTVIDNIVCTTLARTIIDVAADLTELERIRLVDDFQRRGCSLQWLIKRCNVLVEHGITRGPGLVLPIVERRVSGYRVPESWFERLIDSCLQSPLLRGLERQYELRDDGAFVARFDFAIPWVRLGIEAHSRSFHLGELAERYDESRDMRASKVGWDIEYLGFAATRAPDAVRRDIEAIVLRRATDLGLTPPTAA